MSNIYIAFIFSTLLISCIHFLTKEYKNQKIMWLCLFLYTLFCFYYADYYLLKTERAYEHLIKHPEEYNSVLFKKAQIETDPSNERLKYSVDTNLINYLNFIGWYKEPRKLSLGVYD